MFLNKNLKFPEYKDIREKININSKFIIITIFL